MATNIEMDEATYEDENDVDSLHAERPLIGTDGRGSKKRTQTASKT
jgi:hypothetical protein